EPHGSCHCRRGEPDDDTLDQRRRELAVADERLVPDEAELVRRHQAELHARIERGKEEVHRRRVDEDEPQDEERGKERPRPFAGSENGGVVAHVPSSSNMRARRSVRLAMRTIADMMTTTAVAMAKARGKFTTRMTSLIMMAIEESPAPPRSWISVDVPSATTKTNRKPASTPGMARGRTIRRSVVQKPAPRSWLARMTEGSIRASTSTIGTTANGR